MKCRTVNDKINALLDGRARDTELPGLREHLAECSECGLRFHQFAKLKAATRSLPVKIPPPELTTRLKVLASQECAVRRRRASLGAVFDYWGGMLRLRIDNLMRPLAVPFAGGLISALFLFAMLAPMYANQSRHGPHDVPTVLATQAALKRASLSFVVIDREVVVDVLVDDQGRMLDYSAPAGQVWQYNKELRRCVENTLLCTQFTPATMFGQPKSAVLRITLRSNQVDVQG